MREIKFRAWHKYGGGMMVVDSLYFNNDLVGVVDKSHETRVMGYSFADVEIMQYTGLKDKKGKEIYEKDVISSVSSYQQEYGIVEFVDGAFCVVVTSSRTTLSGSKYFLSTCKELEVIGNIYENPELLKKEQSK